jgi:hypothetical protein
MDVVRGRVVWYHGNNFHNFKILTTPRLRIFDLPRQVEFSPIAQSGPGLRPGYYAGWLARVDDQTNTGAPFLSSFNRDLDDGFCRILVCVLENSRRFSVCIRNAASFVPKDDSEMMLAVQYLCPLSEFRSTVLDHEHRVFTASPFERQLAFFALTSAGGFSTADNRPLLSDMADKWAADFPTFVSPHICKGTSYTEDDMFRELCQSLVVSAQK